MCLSTATPSQTAAYRRRCVVSHPKTEPLALADTVVYSPSADGPRCSCGEKAAWFRQSALLVATPRCPTCLAARAMMWSGMGLSLGMATGSWMAFPVLCVVYLAHLAVKSVQDSVAV